MIKYLHNLNEIPINAKIYIYGSGEAGIIFYKNFVKYRKDIEVLGFLDTYKPGKKCKLRVYKLENIHIKKCDIILITSMFYIEIIKTLKKNKINNYKIVNLSFFSCFNNYLLAKNKIEKVKSFLDSKTDIMIYNDVIENRIFDTDKRKNIFGKFIKVDYKNQYIDFIDKDKIKVIIDGGLYSDEDLLKFLKFRNGKVEIHSFEPLLEYCKKKFSNLNKLSKRKNIFINKMALWNKNGTINFFKNESTSKVVSTKNALNTVEVQSITIDQYVTNMKINKVDFIKLDIEGAELSVLQGAIKTLREHSPQLAISIYHQPEHLYQIPLFLHKILKDYIFKINHYSCFYNETILYCIPKSL